MLEHEDEIDLLKTVESVESLWCGGNAGYSVQREQRLSSEIVGRQHVVIHYSEEQHRTFPAALFHRHRTGRSIKPCYNWLNMPTFTAFDQNELD